MNKLSPVVIFCYQRVKHTKLLIESLLKNYESKETILYIFSDGYKNYLDKFNVEKVRKYISKLKGFKRIIIIERNKNLGLSDNIISGINYVFKRNHSAIFLEDDLVVSKNFLRFMNRALVIYSSKPKVWHISGWNYLMKNKKLFEDEKDAFLWRVMNCWGWATWKKKWKFYNKNPEEIIKKWNKQKIKKFNLDNCYDFYSQVIRNKENVINTWAVFWYSTIFNHKGLCLSPKISLVKNNGSDKLSTHKPYKDENNLIFDLSFKKNFNFPLTLKEDPIMVNNIKTSLKKNFIKKLFQYIKIFT